MLRRACLTTVVGLLSAGFSFAAPFAVVPGPSSDPACYKPWDAKTEFVQWPAKKGPYRIALANGFVGNTWRIQMIKTAKAYADQPAVKADLKEFKVVSTGEDLPAQIAAVNNFIDAGYDAVIVDALNPEAFASVVKKAKAAGVALVSFDNTIKSKDNIVVDVNQTDLGRVAAQWLVEQVKANDGKILEVRGLVGNSADSARHDGFREVLNKSGKKFEVVEVVGKWDDGTGQKAAADAIAVHKNFVGVYTQAGSAGVVRALLDAKHPMIPVAGETENGFRKLCDQYASQGLHCSSAGTGPAQVAVAMKVALSALKGEKMPQAIALPLSVLKHPDFKKGVNFYPDLADNFFVGNSFDSCKIGFTAEEIMGKSEGNQ